MTISTRSQALLLGSALAPIALVIFRFAYVREKETAHARSATLLDYHPGFSLDAMAVVGIVCFVASLISLFSDFRSVQRP